MNAGRLLHPGSSPRPLRLLAFDTSTDRLSVGVSGGVSDGDRVWLHEGAGGAQASSTLIPMVLQLLADAGLRLDQLDAIAFGRGPGSFTGLRTACAVAQGLALGAGVPVLPVDTLLAVAEEARAQLPGIAPQSTHKLTAMLDARMDEMYVQHFSLQAGVLTALGPAGLLRPEMTELAAHPDHWLAGNVFEPYAGRLPAWPESRTVRALPTAAALLRLAPELLAAGAAVPAAQALPLYVRNKVAQTTAERMQAKHAAQGAT
jgi:tRNA threonylcarbamoyladenosine biosynthesis protein TsaB